MNKATEVVFFIIITRNKAGQSQQLLFLFSSIYKSHNSQVSSTNWISSEIMFVLGFVIVMSQSASSRLSIIITTRTISLSLLCCDLLIQKNERKARIIINCTWSSMCTLALFPLSFLFVSFQLKFGLQVEWWWKMVLWFYVVNHWSPKDLT